MNYESIPETDIQQILEIVSGTWSREAVAYTIYFASNDLDKAVEYLYFVSFFRTLKVCAIVRECVVLRLIISYFLKVAPGAE